MKQLVIVLSLLAAFLSISAEDTAGPLFDLRIWHERGAMHIETWQLREPSPSEATNQWAHSFCTNGFTGTNEWVLVYSGSWFFPQTNVVDHPAKIGEDLLDRMYQRYSARFTTLIQIKE